VPEENFYLQMWRIENSKVIEKIKPRIVDTFKKDGRFRDSVEVLREIADV
jgi:hypothetical protein